MVRRPRSPTPRNQEPGAAEGLVATSRRFARNVDRLRFGPPVAFVYNPLVYAAAPHEAYLRTWGAAPKEALLVGMNPGPFGMAQTGVPFGDASFVRGWLGLGGAVDKPAREHPKRPIEGLACTRGEVSGQRLWGWAEARFGTPARFFARFFVHNYCPLVFMESSGRNFTPDKLSAAAQAPLFAVCDEALREVVEALRPRFVVGVGAFAAARARAALAGHDDLVIGTILHPSPASPAANRGWAPAAEAQLAALGVRLS